MDRHRFRALPGKARRSRDAAVEMKKSRVTGVGEAGASRHVRSGVGTVASPPQPATGGEGGGGRGGRRGRLRDGHCHLCLLRDSFCEVPFSTSCPPVHKASAQPRLRMTSLQGSVPEIVLSRVPHPGRGALGANHRWRRTFSGAGHELRKTRHWTALV